MSLAVPCPNCSKKLKLPSKEALGKVAKCPACGQRFQLSLPKKQPASPQRKQRVPVGIDARYVPEEPAQQRQSRAVAAAAPAEDAFHFSPPDETPDFTPPDFSPSDESSAGSETGSSETSDDPIAAFKAKRAAKRKKMTTVGVTAAVLFAIVGGAVVMSLPITPRQPSQPAPVAAAPQIKRPSLQIESPTRGEAIPTNLMPAGVGLIVHLRPAEIWTAGRGSAIVGALPPSLKPWAERAIADLALRTPDQIAELTIGFVFGARGVPPRTAVVVRTVESKPLGDFLQEFPGEIERFDDMRLVKTGDKAIFIKDENTFAVAPVELGDDLPDAIDGVNPYLSGSISQIVEQTDRDRLFSVVVGVDDFDIHGPSLLSESMIELANTVIETTDNPYAFAWSVHPGENLYNEFLVQPRTGTNPVAAEQKLLASFEKVPQTLVNKLKLRNPLQPTVRELVGRYPAMLEAARLSTDIVADTRNGVVDVRTLLPSIAGPNIALGSVLTYNVMAMAPPTQAVVSQPVKPVETDNRTVAEKLETQVEGQFTRMPLQEALGYLADEAKIELEIDGDALKSAGYTKNMAQTFDMGQVTVKEALKQISAQYEKMAVAIDTDASKLVVLTKEYAEKRGLKPIEF